MARPQKLQRLKHGRILSAGAFPGFVATWNWLCAIVEGWVGDQDLGGDGCIHVDRTNADVPVIRLDEVKLGRRLKLETLPDYGCWRIVGGEASAEVTDPETGETETITSTVHIIDHQYLQVGGTIVAGSDQSTVESFLAAGKPFLAAKVVYSGGGGYSVSLSGYESFAAMQADSLERAYSIIPLYELVIPDLEEVHPRIVVKTDFRAIPMVQAFEMPYTPPPPEEEEES